jgi:hypothetical protein
LVGGYTVSNDRTTRLSEGENPAQGVGFREYRHGDSNADEGDDKPLD